MEALYVEIPPALKYLLDDDDRTNKAVIIEALERELGVSSDDSIAIVTRKIRREEQRLQEFQADARDASERVSRVKDDLEVLRGIKDEKEATEGDYDDALDGVLDAMEHGRLVHIDPHHPRLDDLRGEFDRSTDEIHYDLRVRAAEQCRGLNNTNFVQKMQAEQLRRRGDERQIEDSDGLPGGVAL